MKFNKLISLIITTSIIGTSIFMFNTNANAATTTQNISTTTNSSVVNDSPMLKYGSKGQNVYLLQCYLNTLNIYNSQLSSVISQLDADGVFGTKTLEDIKAYQKYKNLTVDGIVGTGTWNALKADLSSN